MPTGLGGEVMWFSATNSPDGTNQGSYTGGDVDLDNNGGSIGDLDGTNDSFLSPGLATQWKTPQNYTSSNPSLCSIAFWFKADSMGLSGSYGGLGQNIWPGSFQGEDFHIVKVNTNAELIYWDDVNNSRRSITVGTGTRYGQGLVHLAATYSVELNQIKYYENGVLQVTSNPVTPLSNLELTNKSFAMINHSGGSVTNGHQEDMRIYERLLSDAEVAHLALSPNIEGGAGGAGINATLLGVG
jgi:hypothetical protein